MPTVVQLTPVRPDAFDTCLAILGRGRLTRGTNLYLESDATSESLSRALALAGVRVSSCETPPPPTRGLRPAIAQDLARLDPSLQVIDIVDVHSVALGVATTALMRRRLPFLPRTRAAQDSCRRLLREEDSVLGWRRIVWGSVAALRAARANVRLRPVVFDHDAIDLAPLRWTYVSHRAIERWAFA